MESFTLDKLAKTIGGDVVGVKEFLKGSIEDSTICSESGICYLKDKNYLQKLSTKPGAVITTKELSEQVHQTNNFIIVDYAFLSAYGVARRSSRRSSRPSPLCATHTTPR